MPARKPTRLKLITGTARPDRVDPAMPALPALDAAPTPPRWLTDPEALREWHRLAPILISNKLLHAGNVSALAHLCAVHGKLAADANVNAAGLTAYRALANALGLIGFGPPIAKPANPFAKFLKR